MSGRHRKQSRSNTGRLVAIAATTGAFAAISSTGAIATAHDWTAVAQCESSGNWADPDSGGTGHYGGLQFAQSTWEEFGGLDFAERADYATPEQQIIVAERVLAAQGEGAWECITAYGAEIGYGEGTPVTEEPAPAPEIAPAAPEPPPAPEAPLSGYEWPVDAPVSQDYSSGHDGTDFAAPVGTPIHAVTSGTVSEAGFGNDPGGYGNYIQIQGDDGSEVQYGHVSEIYVSPGDYVPTGAVIGATGNAGSSTGPHLHLRVHTGQGAVDPAAFLNSVGAANTGEHVDPPVPEVPEAAPVPEPAPDAGVQDVIVVVPGDTLSGIAAERGMTWQEIWGLNPQIADPNLIYPDDTIAVS